MYQCTAMQKTTAKRKRVHETDDESVNDSVPKKSKKYFCKWKPEYTKDYVHFTASKRGASHAYCVLCKQDFSISHGGRNDLDKHKNTLSHCQAEKSTSDASSFKDFFTCRTTSNLEEDTIRAEAVVSIF